MCALLCWCRSVRDWDSGWTILRFQKWGSPTRTIADTIASLLNPIWYQVGGSFRVQTILRTTQWATWWLQMSIAISSLGSVWLAISRCGSVLLRKKPKQSLVLERPWDFFQEMCRWTINLAFCPKTGHLKFPWFERWFSHSKPATVHVDQPPREPGIRGRMRDIRIKVQGHSAWQRKFLHVSSTSTESMVYLASHTWSEGWIRFQCLNQQHPRSQRRPWYLRFCGVLAGWPLYLRLENNYISNVRQAFHWNRQVQSSFFLASGADCYEATCHVRILSHRIWWTHGLGAVTSVPTVGRLGPGGNSGEDRQWIDSTLHQAVGCQKAGRPSWGGAQWLMLVRKAE